MLNAGPSGFYNAPVTKALLILSAFFSLCASLLNGRRVFNLNLIPGIMEKLQLWRLFTHNFLFSNPGEMLFGLLLVYYFRVKERQMGSSRFAAFAFISYLLSTLFQVGLSAMFRDLNKSMACGPFGFIFACFVQFFTDVPVSYRFRVFGLNLTDKSFTYLLGLQLFFSQFPVSSLAALCGIFAGLAYQSDTLRLRNFKFPAFLVRLSTRLLLPLLASSPVEAGLTAQARQQQQQQQQPQQQRTNADLLAAQLAQQQGTQGYTDTLLPATNFAANPLWAARALGGGGVPVAQGIPPPREEDVATLTSMGFSRQAVLTALQQAGNDLHAATNLLLDQH